MMNDLTTTYFRASRSDRFAYVVAEGAVPSGQIVRGSWMYTLHERTSAGNICLRLQCGIWDMSGAIAMFDSIPDIRLHLFHRFPACVLSRPMGGRTRVMAHGHPAQLGPRHKQHP